jgi:hypothetical protein
MQAPFSHLSSLSRIGRCDGPPGPFVLIVYAMRHEDRPWYAEHVPGSHQGISPDPQNSGCAGTLQPGL